MHHVKSASGPAPLLLDANGNPIPHLANCVTVLSPLESFFAYNDLKHATVLVAEPPWHKDKGEGDALRWDDSQIMAAQMWVQRKGLPVGFDVVARAVEVLARERTFHPVRDYLGGLKWDGNQRLDTWLSVYLDAEENDYTSAVGGRFLVGAVARVFEPGCKMDYMLVLEGDQGDFKSSVAQILGGEFYIDGLGSEGKLNRDAILSMAGYWIVEIGEVDEALRHNNASRVKTFLSRQVDSYRPPYGRSMVQAKRQCVFIGTTNHDVYLHDPTGNRRFLPVRVWTKPGRVRNANSLTYVRDQILAEAVARYRDGERHWFEGVAETAMLAREQNARCIPHAAAADIEQYCKAGAEWRSPVAISEVFDYIVGPCGRSYLAQQGNLMKQIPIELRKLGYTNAQHRDPNCEREASGGRGRVRLWWRLPG